VLDRVSQALLIIYGTQIIDCAPRNRRIITRRADIFGYFFFIFHVMIFDFIYLINQAFVDLGSKMSRV
jgi:hypothetical protein